MTFLEHLNTILRHQINKYTKLDYRCSQSIKRNTPNTPNNEHDDSEEMDSFLLAEQIANDEVMQNPLHDTVVELMSLKTQGNT
jgi:hypothetical protein